MLCSFIQWIYKGYFTSLPTLLHRNIFDGSVIVKTYQFTMIEKTVLRNTVRARTSKIGGNEIGNF